MNIYHFNVDLVKKDDRRQRRRKSLSVDHFRLKDAWDKAEQLAKKKFPDEEPLLSLGAM